MSRQLSFRSPCNNANGVKSPSHSPVGHVNVPRSHLLDFGGQVTQGFSCAKFDPEYKCFGRFSFVRSVIERKAARDDNLLFVQEHGELPDSVRELENEIILTKTSLIAEKDELARKMQAVENSLSGVEYAEDHVSKLKQIKEDGAIDHSTWTIETVKLLARRVDFVNDSFHSIKKKLGLTVIEDLRAIKSKIVLETLLFVAYRGGLAKNAEFVRNMAQLKEEGTFAIDFNTKQIFYEKKFNEATLLWCAAFYFFLDVKEVRHNDELEDKIFRLAKQKESPWIERSFVQQVPQGLESQAMHANIFVGCKHQLPDTSRDESAPNVSFSFGSVSRSSKKRGRHWQDEDQVER